MELNCKQCNDLFTAKNKRQVYCSSKCRTKACRVRHNTGKLSELIKEKVTEVSSATKTEVLSSSVGSMIGNTFSEVVNPKATLKAQKRIETKVEYLMNKVDDIALGQFSASLALHSNDNVWHKPLLIQATTREEEIEKDPQIKDLKDIELERSWIDRNLYWVAPTATIIILYGLYKTLQTTQEKEVA